MKKFIVMLAMLSMTLIAKAQFEEGKMYLSANATGIDLNYNGMKDLSFGIQAKGGLFFDDCWQINGLVGFNHAGKGSNNLFEVGVGGRYYVEENGIFVGANCKLELSKGYTDLMPGLELGYAFFLNDKVTIEPAVYYDQSLKNHSDYSTIGIKIGFGLYF